MFKLACVVLSAIFFIGSGVFIVNYTKMAGILQIKKSLVGASTVLPTTDLYISKVHTIQVSGADVVYVYKDGTSGIGWYQVTTA